ncbi:aspartic proteinase 36 isoform X2 [Vitis vinifera]|uniref:aspartic proteinase 36 isoform X2 n=1 Tax=Vitis vinifera TaxID=29760 RepID=UPI00053FA291|nr:aspartic proteinase 36 isoform X2 [Vitis vinifera]|eukprot:XP_010654010.1 PREDICTED: aspartic proteinase-like protein 2 isoform X2 [Vitis vinifera]
MPSSISILALILAFAAILLTAAVVHCGSPASLLTLERAFPVNQRVELEVLRARDQARHGRLLRGVVGGVVDFTVYGTSDPYLVGLYFTKVKLGSPPREFNVQIDTGSDILWVTCNSCNDCPRTSGLGIELSFFDPSSSSTTSLVSCSHPICTSLVQTTAAECSPQSNQCSYSFHYGDGSGTTGYYVSDMLYFDTVLGDSLIANSSASIVFGSHYNLNLQSISVNGQLLPIDPAVFATSNNQGTIVDSGTTLTYLVETAYDPFVSAITATVSSSTTPVLSKGNQCYLVSTSVDEIFPPVSLNFAGGASMVLKPGEYLMHLGFSDGAAMWCIGFQKVAEPGITILGDLVLKDKIFVYDLAHQRIGWANYDCSLSVNVSVTSGKDEFINSGQLSMSSSSQNMLFEPIPRSIKALLIHILVFSGFLFFVT